MAEEIIQIFDTTLRDGQQCPGAGMSFDDNLHYAELAADVGVDILEAGFPAASSTDFQIVNEIAKLLSKQNNSPKIAALCQLREAQVVITAKALEPVMATRKARLHTYLPVDPQLMQASLGSYANDKPKILKDVHDLITLACNAGCEVEFSPEGYSRMGDTADFVLDVIRAAVSAGATVINCPDTIGGACKWQGDEYFVRHMRQHAAVIAKEFPGRDVIWSAHCHNDFGLALENTMNAVFEGPVRQIEGCFNGIGERAGNVSLEQCIIYIQQFGAMAIPGKLFKTHANIEKLQGISNFVAEKMLSRQAHWPVTGDNAARHTSGGHINAILSNPLAYQPFDPSDVGKEISFVFGPMSGGNHAKAIIEQQGYRCEDHEKAAIAQFIKDHYSDRRKGITDQELIEAYLLFRYPVRARSFQYQHQNNKTLLAIEGRFFEHNEGHHLELESDASALSALHKAILDFVEDISIESYKSEAAGKGIQAESRSTIVILTADKQLYTGVGVDQDIEISALKALSDAVNQAYIERHFRL